MPPDRVRQVYDRLGVNSGYLSSDAAAWFRAGRALPINFTEVGRTPVIQRLVAGGISVAVVHFPALPADSPFAHLPEAIKSVVTAARSVDDAQLVIGMSPWGHAAEEEALPLLQKSFQLLIGGGTGRSFAAYAPQAAPDLLWARPSPRGRNVSLVDIMNLPERGQPWTPGLDVEAREASLSAEVPDDHEVAALLR